MVDDIVPGLLGVITSSFDKKTYNSNQLKKSLNLLKEGKANYLTVNDFAIEVGEILSVTFKENITAEVLPDGKMYFNIADRILNTTLKKNYDLVSSYATEVQNLLNQEANIRIKAQIPDFNNNRVEGLVNKIASEDDFDNIKWLLEEPIVNFTQSIVDDSIKKNADFQFNSGLSPIITRHVSGHACAWCKNLSGTFPYHSEPVDFYRRHGECRCLIEFNPKDGRGVQNSHTKKWIKEKFDRIKMSKNKELSSSLKSGDRMISDMLNADVTKPMTIFEADRSNANPNFYKGKEFQINCQRCVPTYELRRRGIDVEAMSAVDRTIWDDVNCDIISYSPGKAIRGINAFIDPETKQPVTSTLVRGNTMKQNFLRLENIVQDGERYSLSMAWSKNGAHIVNMERIDGVLSIVDAQGGVVAPIEEYFKFRKAQPKSLNYCRIDNLDINPKLAERIAIPKKKR